MAELIRGIGGAVGESALAVQRPDLYAKMHLAKMVIGGVTVVAVIGLVGVLIYKSKPVQASAPVVSAKAKFAKFQARMRARKHEERSGRSIRAETFGF